MSEKLVSELQPVSFGARFAGSQSFTALFREGMKLVEETAAYLDGSGRQEAKKLTRIAALAYATESMRLTTRLMQLASWLLLHRAVNEGEMPLDQANIEKNKVRLTSGDRMDAEVFKLLPDSLRQLIARCGELEIRVRRLDMTLHSDRAVSVEENPVERQIDLLKRAFETS